MSDGIITRLVENAEARVGTSLRGKYLLERLIGVGATAAVYAGTHRNGLRAAVKVLHPEVARISEARRRFLREGYIANRIDHPGVVRVLDDDEDEAGGAFIVMELLSGHTLESDWTANGGRLPLGRVIAVVDVLLDVLDAAHAAGVIHRDIKPDNLFLTDDGALKVLDFGIARLIDSSSATRSGQMMGTPEFVAPEQAGGFVRDIDARTDIYSVGSMMFTLLSGQYTHIARSPMEYMVFAATKPARSIFDVMPDVDPAVANVIDVALSFEKQRRWANASQMRTALRSAVSAKGPVAQRNVAPAAAPQAPAPLQISGTSTVRVGEMTLDSGAQDEPIPLVHKAK